MRGNALAHEPQFREHSNQAGAENVSVADRFKRCCNKHRNSERLCAAGCVPDLLQPSPLSIQTQGTSFDSEVLYVRHPVEASRCPIELISGQRGRIRFGFLITPILLNITLIKLPIRSQDVSERKQTGQANYILPKLEP